MCLYYYFSNIEISYRSFQAFDIAPTNKEIAAVSIKVTSKLEKKEDDKNFAYL